jgi:hypothetical protein
MATKFYNPMSNGSNAPIQSINGHSREQVNGTGPAPLNIAIVGAGIGGLTAAIGLRRNGHHVSVSYRNRCLGKLLTFNRSMNSPDSRTRLEPLFILLPIRMESYVGTGYLPRASEVSQWKGWPNTVRRANRPDNSI